MPPWGRPSGGVGRNKRRAEYERQMRDWEVRQRFRELESDDDDGVELDPKGPRRGFRGDELYFTGYDMGSARNRGHEHNEYGFEENHEPLDEDDDAEIQNGVARQVAMRDKEELLVQRALERIRRARLKGELNVGLTPDELDALERRRLHQEGRSNLTYPVGADNADRIPSASTASGEKAKKKSSVNLFTSKPPKKGAKFSRKAIAVTEPSYPYDVQAATAPGFLVTGPEGPTYTPLGYYSPPSSRSTPGPSRRDSPSNSRPPSSSSRHNITPPIPPQYLPRYQGGARYFSQPDTFRPSTSSRGSPTRSLPDDPAWVPRSRSASLAAMYPGPYSAQHQAGPPFQPGPAGRPEYVARRNVSGPAEISYSSLRRAPPNAAMTRPGASEPMLLARTSSGLSQEIGLEASSTDDDEDEDEDDSEDQGVQVDVVPDDRGGYTVVGGGGGSGGRGATGVGGFGGGGRQRIGKR